MTSHRIVNPWCSECGIRRSTHPDGLCLRCESRALMQDLYAAAAVAALVYAVLKLTELIRQ